MATKHKVFCKKREKKGVKLKKLYNFRSNSCRSESTRDYFFHVPAEETNTLHIGMRSTLAEVLFLVPVDYKDAQQKTPKNELN